MILNYIQIGGILGIAALSALGFYAIRLLASFKTGLLAKSWRQVAIGAFLLILAQIPFFLSGFGELSDAMVYLTAGAMVMRLAGVIFFILGLRAQSKVWRLESKTQREEENSAPLVEMKR